jgi:hypothetical protein
MRAWAVQIGSLAALAACGDGIHPPATDAPVDDQRGLVTLTVRSDVTRVDDLLVYFQNADSQLVLSTRTDRVGVANAYMAPGGFVTMVDPSMGVRVMYTYAGVKPGDELVLDLRSSPNIGQVELQVEFPAEPSSMFYELYASCSFGGPTSLQPPPEPASVSLFGCPPTANFLIRASDEVGGSKFLYRPEAPVMPFGALTMQGAYQPASSTTLSATHVPPGITDLFVTQQVGGLPFPNGSFSTLSPVEGHAQIAINLVPAEGALLATRLDAPDTGLHGVQHVIQTGPNAATEIDLRGGLRAYTSRPRFEPTSQTIQWTEADAGVVPDFVITQMSFFNGAGSSQWVVISPRTTEPIQRLPVLPRAELDPPADPNNLQIFTLLNVAIDGGYDRVRATKLTAWSRNETWPTDRAPGQALFQTLGNAIDSF